MNIFKKVLLPALLTAPMIAVATPVVDINNADTLRIHQDLIGVTEGMAHDIVEYREENGKFDSVNEILKVESVNRDYLNINRYRIHTNEDPRLGS